MTDHGDHGEGIVGPRPETATGEPVPSPRQALTVFWCPACGWDDHSWGADFWQRHYEPGEDRRPGLDCLDGGGPSTTLTYTLTEGTNA